MTRIRIGRSLLAAALAVAGTASVGTAQDTPKYGGTLSYVLEGETNTYDCHASGTSFTLQAVSPHYSTLLRFVPGDYANVEGDLAESWEVSDDGTVYTFKLRDGVTFHDGSTFDAEDVKASWDRMIKPPEGVVSVRQARFGGITNVEVVDPLTIRFTLDAPNAAALTQFASPWNCIYSAEDLAKDPNFPAANINGTGPFRFVEHVKGDHWSGEKFENYFREGQPYLDGVRGVFIRGPGVMTALLGGQVNGTFFLLAPPDVERLVAERGDAVTAQDTDVYIINLLAVNTTKAPFDDPRVRRALNLAIDRRQGSEVLPKITIARGYGTMLPPGSKFALPEEEFSKLPGLMPDIAASREEAKRLLAEAGVPDLSFTLLNRNLRHPWEPLGIFLIDQWRQIGVNVTMESADTATYFAKLNEKNFDVALDFNNTTTAEPAEVLSKYIPANPSDYSGQPADPEMTAMYDKIVRSQDDAERMALAADFQKRVFETSAMIPMFWSFRPIVLESKVKGWVNAPSTVLNLDMGGVWLDE